MVKYAALAVLIAASACSAEDRSTKAVDRPLPPPGVEACSKSAKGSERTSIAALIANPERFEGKPVFVVAYYKAGFEHSAIYLHREDATEHITANGLWVQASVPEPLHGRYIGVEAIFTGLARGHLSQWSGTLCGVTRVVPWGPAAP